MPLFRKPAKPAQPVKPTKSKRQQSRLCFGTWGSGCREHGGGACRCTLTWRHGGSCECYCGDTN